MKVLFLVPPSKFAKNVARDLVYGCWCRGKRIGGVTFPPVSLTLAATVLKNSGHQVCVLDAMATQTPLTTLKKKIHNFDAVVVLTSTSSINEDAQILKELKMANKNLKTIVFGGHPTAMPKETLSKPGIDIIIRREVELVLRDLINAFEKGKNWEEIKGIGFKKKGKPVINDFYPLIENLDDLPIPDRTLLPKNIHYFNPIVRKVPFTTMFSARGCPGLCVFCASPIFYGHRVRLRSAQSVLAEFEEIKRLDFKEVFIRDEIFTASKKRVLEICEGMIKKDLKISWICSSRIDSIDREMLKIMKRAGCHLIRFGVESGSQEILDNSKKGIRLTQTKKVFRWCRKFGIDTHAHLMIGMPGDTVGTIKKTIDFAVDLNPSLATFGICTPFPGTRLFTQVATRFPEIVDGSAADLSKLHTSAFYNRVFTEVSEEELGRLLRLAYRKFYLKPSLWLKWLTSIKSIGELRRATLAAAQVFDFAFRGDDKKSAERED
ncbi:radical SAM protein [Candidatus Microgenomates bacterium]|nr:radical SAM protein [Candidatus Microgenomates bacterium]